VREKNRGNLGTRWVNQLWSDRQKEAELDRKREGRGLNNVCATNNAGKECNTPDPLLGLTPGRTKRMTQEKIKATRAPGSQRLPNKTQRRASHPAR